MGARKQKAADIRKAENKTRYFARLVNCPTSPRKMRLVADMVRGLPVEKAMFLLKFNPKEASGRLEKLLRSAISNWQQKNEGARLEDGNLFVKDVFVDSGFQLKRLRVAPQGRGHRIRKRSNHVTLVIDSMVTATETK